MLWLGRKSDALPMTEYSTQICSIKKPNQSTWKAAKPIPQSCLQQHKQTAKPVALSMCRTELVMPPVQGAWWQFCLIWVTTHSTINGSGALPGQGNKCAALPKCSV